MDRVATGFRSKGRNTSARLARSLAADIIDGSRAEGSRLPTESEMVAAVGVSRGTLREALRLLEVWGLVEIRQGLGGGPFVRKPQLDEFTDHVALALQCRRLSLSDVADARLALEPMVAGMAAERIGDDELAELRVVVREMEDSVDDAASFSRHSAEFHDRIAAASDSVVLRVFLTALREISHESAKALSWSRAELVDAVQSHQRILSRLADGDVMGAESAMAEHLRVMNALTSEATDHLAQNPGAWSTAAAESAE